MDPFCFLALAQAMHSHHLIGIRTPRPRMLCTCFLAKKKALCVSHHILVYHSTDLPCICCVPLRIVKYSLASPIAPILASSTHPNSGLYILANQSFKRPTSNLSAGRTTKSLSGQVLASYPPCAGPSTSASQAAKPSRTRHRSRARDRGSR